MIEKVPFATIVKNCKKKRNLKYARSMYVNMFNEEQEVCRESGNYVVPMFVSCGSVYDAQQVFNGLFHQNENSWSSLMLGYIECGDSQFAFSLYQKMQEDYIFPSSYTFLGLLRACAIVKNLETGRKIHDDIKKWGFQGDHTVGNSLVHMYAKCGSLVEARKVFNKLPSRDIVSWNALMAGYTENGLGVVVLECFEEMQVQAYTPDAVTYVCSLKACSITGATEKGREVHALLYQKGFGREAFIGSSLVRMYAKFGSILEAVEVFDRLSVQDTVSWNALIAGYIENGAGLEALKCFAQMQQECLQPNAVTLICILKACGTVGAIQKGREIHTEIVQKGRGMPSSISSSLVGMYAKCGSLEEAEKLFEQLPLRDVATWNTLIAGYAENGLYRKLLKCFMLMEWENISPDAVAFVHSLTACGAIGDMQIGRQIHVQIAEIGLEGEPSLGVKLIEMYIQHGTLVEACSVFDKLQHHHSLSWNALISGYTENRNNQKALECFAQMQLEGMPLDALTYVYGLKACSNIGLESINEGRIMHTGIVYYGFEKDPVVLNSLVNMYAKCRSLTEAWEVFSKMSVRDVISWTAIIGGHVENGQACAALNLLEQMQLEGVQPNAITIICSLKACSSIGALERGRKVHAEFCEGVFLRDVFTFNTLIGMYSKCGSLAEAQSVFEKMPVRDVTSWNAIIAEHAEHGHWQEALRYFDLMKLENLAPNAITFIASLKACNKMVAIEHGRKMHADILKRGYEKDSFVANSLVHMYAQCGSLVDAQQTFDNLAIQNIVSWNTIIAGYLDNGHQRQALDCFLAMEQEENCPDAITYASSLRACCNVENIERGREMHTEIVQKGLENDVSIGSSLVNMYGKCGLLAEAQEVFDNIQVRNVVTWTALMAGYAGSGFGFGQETLNCFKEIQDGGLSEDAATFVCSLKGCGNIGALDKGRKIHDEITQKGLETDVFVGNALIDMYAKGGALMEARMVFDKLLVQNVVSWNTIIGGYGMNHDANMAIQCFEAMQKEGINPDSTTFTCVLLACSRASLLVKGQRYFTLFSRKYKIAPTIDHYTSLVDLFARAGHLFEADALLKSVLGSACKEAWTSLLSSCKTYGEAELGLRCFDKLVEMDFDKHLCKL